MKRFTLTVMNREVSLKRIGNEDFISLTDMVRGLDNGTSLVEKWLRNKNTIEFLGIWERLHNPDFDFGAYEEIMSQSGLNRFLISAKQWIEKTKAIGIMAQAGRYGGTYAHKDIAFEFGSWVNPTFKLYLITEYQNLNILLSDKRLKEWDVRRILSKANYTLQTDAIKNHVIPKMRFGALRQKWIYADEADALNLIVFGTTASQWKKANPELAKLNLNMREAASINQLAVLANLESLNSHLIRKGITDLKERKSILHAEGKEQLQRLDKLHLESRFSKLEHLGNPKYLK